MENSTAEETEALSCHCPGHQLGNGAEIRTRWCELETRVLNLSVLVLSHPVHVHLLAGETQWTLPLVFTSGAFHTSPGTQHFKQIRPQEQVIQVGKK